MNGATQLRLELLHEALRLSQDLLQDRPDDPSARKHTALVQKSIGELWQGAQSFNDGDQAYRESIEIWESLLQEFPDNAAYKEECGLTTRQRARLLERHRRYAEAEKEYRKVIEASGCAERRRAGKPELS